VQLVGPFPATLAQAGATAMTPVAGNATDHEEVSLTGREIVVVRNSGASARTITFTSAADPYNRTGDVTDSLAAGKIAFYGPFSMQGWAQTGGKLHFDVGHADCLISVIRLP
jgi:hypothetical protein